MPEWTRTKPQIEGFYWITMDFGEPVIIQVEPKADIYYFCGRSNICVLSKLEGEFYGPLIPPGGSP